MVAEQDGKNNTVRYVRGLELLSSDCECARTYYHYASDELGSITHVTDENGTVLNRYVYDAFGNQRIKEETVQNRFGFTGEICDGLTGQYYLRARFYNPVIGRFLNEDTYYGDGLNLYSYCRNNPVRYVDPSGHDACPKKSRDSKIKEDKGTQHGETSSSTALTTYYLPNNGALGESKRIHLMAGDIIDRYGRLQGKFFSPANTPMEMRALPPGADLSQYRVFKVIKPFEVEASTIAPAFGKIGLGTQ